MPGGTLQNNTPQRLFFSGIAGSGVSALAMFMALRGHRVSGSDRLFDSGRSGPLREYMENAGIRITPQDASGITDDLGLVVMSTAVEKDSPEILRVKELDIRTMTRPEFLASLSERHRSIAMAGTSGKSTASAWLACALRELGADPSYLGGGRARDLRTSSSPGNVLAGGSDILVMEADESDGSIVNYSPFISVVENLSLDHNPVEETAEMFKKLINNTTGRVAVNADDKGLMGLRTEEVLTFSIDSPSDIRAEGISTQGILSRFSISGQGFEISQPGLHNIYNALAVISVLRILGYELSEISRAVAAFSGIERRFEIHLEKNGRMVIDDYAHNPHKIAAMMDTVAGLSRSACYIFQPHGFGPLRLMLKDYAKTFNSRLREKDRLFLLPVYYTGGTVRRDIGHEDLASLCRAGTVGDRASLIAEIAKSPLNDCYVVFGARDESLSELAGEITESISSRF